MMIFGRSMDILCQNMCVDMYLEYTMKLIIRLEAFW